MGDGERPSDGDRDRADINGAPPSNDAHECVHSVGDTRADTFGAPPSDDAQDLVHSVGDPLSTRVKDLAANLGELSTSICAAGTAADDTSNPAFADGSLVITFGDVGTATGTFNEAARCAKPTSKHEAAADAAAGGEMVRLGFPVLVPPLLCLTGTSGF